MAAAGATPNDWLGPITRPAQLWIALAIVWPLVIIATALGAWRDVATLAALRAEPTTAIAWIERLETRADRRGEAVEFRLAYAFSDRAGQVHRGTQTIYRPDWQPAFRSRPVVTYAPAAPERSVISLEAAQRSAATIVWMPLIVPLLFGGAWLWLEVQQLTGRRSRRRARAGRAGMPAAAQPMLP